MGAKGKSGKGEKGHKHRGSRLIKRSIISSIIARHLVLLGSSGLIPWKGEREEEGNKLEKKKTTTKTKSKVCDGDAFVTPADTHQ